MPVSCFGVNCTNRFKTGLGIGFYVFAVNEDKRKAWILAVSQDKQQPKPSDRLCGAHFGKGRPSKDPNDIDFIPTIFEDKKRRVRVAAVGSMRAERRAKRAKLHEEGEDALATADNLSHCTGNEQQQRVALPPRMHLVRLILHCCQWMKDTFARIRNCLPKQWPYKTKWTVSTILMGGISFRCPVLTTRLSFTSAYPLTLYLKLFFIIWNQNCCMHGEHIPLRNNCASKLPVFVVSFFFFFASCNSRTKEAIGALLERNYQKTPKLYSFIELVVKAIIFNIIVFVADSNIALRNPTCSNDITYF